MPSLTFKSVTVLLLIGLLSSPATAADVPDLSKTPGLIRTGLLKEKICTIKWGKDERHVTDTMKQQVFQSYGYVGGYKDPQCVADAKGRTCEIDHLISRELGGADDVKNLWPQSYGSKPWNANLKDRLENHLHHEVCAGKITLRQARSIIVSDWRKAYVNYYGKP